MSALFERHKHHEKIEKHCSSVISKCLVVVGRTGGCDFGICVGKWLRFDRGFEKFCVFVLQLVPIMVDVLWSYCANCAKVLWFNFEWWNSEKCSFSGKIMHYGDIQYMSFLIKILFENALRVFKPFVRFVWLHVWNVKYQCNVWKVTFFRTYIDMFYFCRVVI